MENKISVKIEKSTYDQLKQFKEQSEFSNKNWNEFFIEIISKSKNIESTKNTLERIFEKSTYDKYFDDWIQNFTLNLPDIWNGKSAKELISKKIEKKSSAIIIGRGPSIKKNNHLELLANSDYNGTIICSDGVLITALKAGITPDKFKKFFVVTIDTQHRQKIFYDHSLVKKYGPKIKCIISSTISPETLNVIKNSGIEIFWIHTLVDYNKGKNSFNYITGVMSKIRNKNNGLPAIQTGGNVGTSAWIIAWAILKKSHVGIIGMDHGYYSEDRSNDDHIFPKDIDQNSQAFKKAYPIIHNSKYNCDIQQDPIFQYYSNALKEFIRKVSDKVVTINATEGGAIFGDGINCDSLKNFIQKYNF
jgi:hypothetical protein